MRRTHTVILNKAHSSGHDYLKVIVTGDFCPINSPQELSSNRKSIDIFGDYYNILNEKDLSITNLECVLTSENNKLRKIGPCLKANHETIEILKSVNFDVTCLANNHILDYKEKGILDTLNVCKKNNIHIVGAGPNLSEASKPLIIEKKGRKIAILNYADHEFNLAKKDSAGANPFDVVKVCQDIEKVKKETPIVLVIIHGGIEGYNLPSPDFAYKLRFIAKYNPSAIICHHTHISSGYEIVNRVPIFYSLGNFIFDYPKMNKMNYWHEGFFVKFSIEKSGIVRSFELIPYFQFKNKEGLELMQKDDNDKFIKKIKVLSEKIGSQDFIETQFEKYVEKNGMGRLGGMLMPNKVFRKLFRVSYFNKLFFLFFRYRSIYSIINCDAHREILLNYLNKKI